jgi:hypothetical protein
MKRLSILTALFLTACGSLSADLNIPSDHLRIEQSLEGGYILTVKKTDDIGSILLTESTADPDMRVHSYTLRNPEYHPLNGDERRKLDGEFLDPEAGIYSLVDSTGEPDEEFGEAFRIFVPYVVIYGYPWSRQGELMVLDGTWLNIRAFEKPYADYEGVYADNPFVLKVVQKPMEGPPEGNYMEDTVENFTEIAKEGRGTTVFSRGYEDMVDEIGTIIGECEGRTLDLVLALDTTKSMEDNIPYLRELLVPLLEKHTARFEVLRFGLVLYRDYMEQYLVRSSPFRDGLGGLQADLDAIRVLGGRDIPEAVYEALYAAVEEYPWRAEDRRIILIGDAPAHPRPRGKVTKEMVYAGAEERDIRLHTIILPQ